MRHLAFAVLFAAACGGKSKPADPVTVPDEEAEPVEEAESEGIETEDRFGTLKDVSNVEGECWVTLVDNETGAEAVYVAMWSICEEGNAAQLVDYDVALTLTLCGDEAAGCASPTDLVVISVDGMSPD